MKGLPTFTGGFLYSLLGTVPAYFHTNTKVVIHYVSTTHIIATFLNWVIYNLMYFQHVIMYMQL